VVTFAGLLRQFRTEAGLTQEELAAGAGLSARSVSDLERGVALTARKDTARLLADALGLSGAARASFEAVARGRALAGGKLATEASGGTATRTLPRDIASFIGRRQELRQLADSAVDAVSSGGVVSICAIGGMAGVGKTAFAVHAAHQLAPRFPDGQIFLPLHGHTPEQRPVDPADALASLLLTAGIAAAQIPPGLEGRTALWRDHLAGKQLLLLLDDAADSQQVRPLLPGTAGSLVLVTSRRHLTALDDAQAVSLDTLAEEEAAALLVRLAARPGLDDPSNAAVAEVTRLCGYLVRAENPVHGSDQQSCASRRLAVMITDHVPAVRLPPDHAGGRMAAAVAA
jgi:transcriptional regulator with XRE-family HTH domain